ncbi:MAG: hypothetical protein LC751_12100 [Actinobacteria bacterium]|nr:hypothetical protein [Actinomycetota bacterium]MCA1739046.1 hypothetical protein [Actinomycetota bacterium]
MLQLFLRSGEVDEVLLGLLGAVGCPALLGLGLAQVAGEARVLAISRLQFGAGIAGGVEIFLFVGVLPGDLLKFGFEAGAFTT